MRAFLLFLLVSVSSIAVAQVSRQSEYKYYNIAIPKVSTSISGSSSFQSFNISSVEIPAANETREENTGEIIPKIILPTVVKAPNNSTPEKRIALVFGNSNYQKAAVLKNPVNDAHSMTSALKSIGFEVTEVLDANFQGMRNALRDFEDKIYDADVVMCYYAGHGMQVDGINYLIPIDAKLNKKEHIKYEAIDVKMITKIMELSAKQDRLNIVILDACRNNPFRSWSRGGDSGLVKIDPPNGTLIAYATSPNSVASDGDGSNGLYTGELIKQLLIPQRIEDVFIYTRVAVEEMSNYQQTPWEQAKLRGAFYLVK
jgi:uncharacterized caspase-like protein